MDLKKTAHIFFIMMATLGIKGQDFHLSHYDVAGLYMNPATTGMFGKEGNYRFAFDQRSQWSAVGVKPFLTSYLAYEMPYQQKAHKFGLGAYIINNNSGLGGFNKFTFMASGSYNIMLGKGAGPSGKSVSVDKHLLSAGLQMGLFYRSANTDVLRYDVQYTLAGSGGSFDPSIPSNENYNRVNITRFDLNLGLYYRYVETGKKYYPYAGFAMHHLTQPDESMTGGTSRLPMRVVTIAGCNVILNTKTEITPRILFMTQSKAVDFTAGVLANYQITESGIKVLGGIDIRMNDAFIVSLGLNNLKYAVRFSYDFNTSYLSNYTSGRGGFELSLIYTGERQNKPVAKSRASQQM
jgi:type IX secretion system PorP/SprF family membrane protein